MALIHSFLLSFIFAGAPAHAVGVSMIFENVKCSVDQVDSVTKKASKVPQASIFVGRRFDVETLPKGRVRFSEKTTQIAANPSGGIERVSKTIYYFASVNCLRLDDLASPPQAVIPLPKPLPAEPRPLQTLPKPLPQPTYRQVLKKKIEPIDTTHKTVTHYSLALVTWGEELDLVSPTPTTYKLNFRAYTLQFGMNRTWFTPNEHYYFEASLSGMIGGGKATETSDATLQSPIHYQDTDGTVLGISLTPKIFFYHEKKSNLFSAFGMGIPFIFRRAFLADPGFSYTLQGRTSLVYGIAFYPRMDIGDFRFDPAFGFMPSLMRWMISIGISKPL